MARCHKFQIRVHEENQVWNLIDQPDGIRTIEWKWIYKKKKDMDGNGIINIECKWIIA